MTDTSAAGELHDLQPARSTFLADVLKGLGQTPRQLSPKYFYDETGSQLFDRICALPEYYLTRTELAIMQAHAGAMGQALGPDVLLVEPGSGSSVKIRLLLDNLQSPAGYVPVEISREHMLSSTEQLQSAYPQLDIYPVCADFTQDIPLPTPRHVASRRAVYFPGSTIGNFAPQEAEHLLKVLHRAAGPGGAVLLGVDLRKDPQILIPAYDDADGVTAAFNRNLLVRINRELDGNFEPLQFAHRAVWNEPESRIEMHLVSRCRQTVSIGDQQFTFSAGEAMVTEYSYKYTRERLEQLADFAGFTVRQEWTDADRWFSVFYLESN